MKHFCTLLILLMVSIQGFNQAYCQSKFLSQTDIEISYNDVNAWNKFENLQNDNNDGYGFGLALNYTLNQRIHINVKYSLNVIEYLDLNENYMNSYYELKTGYSFQLSELTELIPQVGFGVINLNQYRSIQTELVGNPATRSVTHYSRGEKEPFRKWIVGTRLRHKLSNSMYVGLDLNVYYSFSFDLGRIITSPFISIRPFK